MNIFDAIGNATLALAKLPLLMVGVVKKLLAVLRHLIANAAQKTEKRLYPENPPLQAEGPPRKIGSLTQAPRSSFFPTPGQDLLQRNANAAFGQQRTPSVAAGAANQHPSALAMAEILKKDGWDSVSRYHDYTTDTIKVRLTNKTSNIAKDLSIKEFIAELRKHGFTV